MADPEKALPSSTIDSQNDSYQAGQNVEIPSVAKEVGVIPGNENGKEDEISIAPSRASSFSEHDGDNKTTPLPPATLHRTTSVVPEAVIIDRKNRRGLFASLTLIPEVENPFHYARRTKWLLTITIAFAGMAGPMGSAIVMPVLQEIAEQYHATHTIANMSVAVYMLAMGIFPLWWSSFSETTGRRTIYIISFTLFVVFAILSAISTNISMLIVFRTFSGGAAASVQAVGGGTIADIWEVRERGKAMGLFYLGPLCGPLFAPIIGGALGEELGWRSTQWFLVIYGGITVILLLFALPETLRSKTTATTTPQATATSDKPAARPELTRISTRQSVKQNSRAYIKHFKRIFIDPLVVLTYLRYPPVLLTVYYASITFGSLYFLNISIQATFSAPPYQFSVLIVGLLYIPNSLGYLLTSIFGGRWIDHIMIREATKAGRYDDNGKLIFRPEDRMRENAWIAAVMFPVALIWYAWSAEYGVYWLCPMIANFFFGVGSMLIFSMATTMLTEFMPRRTSAGIAINNFLRSMFSFVGAVTAELAISKIGNGWLFTILGVWSLISGLAVIFTMRKCGPGWRKAMVEGLGQ